APSLRVLDELRSQGRDLGSFRSLEIALLLELASLCRTLRRKRLRELVRELLRVVASVRQKLRIQPGAGHRHIERNATAIEIRRRLEHRTHVLGFGSPASPEHGPERGWRERLICEALARDVLEGGIRVVLHVLRERLLPCHLLAELLVLHLLLLPLERLE